MCDFDLFPGLGGDAEIQYLEGSQGCCTNMSANG